MLRLSTALVFLTAAALFSLRLGGLALWDNDETIYTQIARELAQRGDWITLHWRGEPWFVHPPLHFWLVALLSIPIGTVEVAARLPAVVFGAGCVALVEVWGRSLFSPRAGWLAAATLALNFQFFVESRMANMDTTILFFVALSLYGFWRAYLGERRGWYLMFAASGFACLSKGLFGLAFPWMVALPFLAMSRRLSVLGTVPWLWGGLLTAAIGLTWYGVELARHGAAFGEAVFIHYSIDRLTTRVMNQGGPVWLYLPIVLVGFFPWSLWLPQAMARLWRERRTAERRASAEAGLLILLWIVVPFVFFSAAVTKLPNYILFIYPAAALAVGSEIDAAIAGHRVAGLRAIPAVAGAAALAIVAAIELWAAPRFPQYAPVTWRLTAYLSAVAAAGAFAACIAAYRGAPRASVAALATGMAGFLIGCAWWLTPEIERYRPIKPLALAAKQVWRPGNRLMIHSLPGGHGLEFYSGQSVGVIEDEAGLKRALETTPGLLAVMPRDVYGRLASDERITIISTAGDAVLATSRNR